MTQKEFNEMLLKMSVKVDDMHKCLFGNGRPGLNDRINILETNQKNCQESRKSWKNFLPSLIVGILIALTTWYLSK